MLGLCGVKRRDNHCFTFFYFDFTGLMIVFTGLCGLFTLLLVELSLLLGGGVLVLLVLGHQVVHIGLGLSELHLVHTLASVPVKESLAPEHSGELFRDTLEQLLDGGAVANEGGGHLEAAGWDVADSGLHVVGDPFNEVAAVLVLDVEHLLVDLLHGHASTEHGGDGEIAAVAGVAGGHHVLGVEHLLGEFGDGESSVLLGATGGQRGKSGHEEVETGEGHHVDGKFAKIGVQLTGEAQRCCDPRHGGGDEMVQVTVCRGGELQGSEADVVEGLVVNAVGLVGVLDQLVDGQGGVVGLDDGVRNLRIKQPRSINTSLTSSFISVYCQI